MKKVVKLTRRELLLYKMGMHDTVEIIQPERGHIDYVSLFLDYYIGKLHHEYDNDKLYQDMFIDVKI